MISIAPAGNVRRLDALCTHLLVEWLGGMVKRRLLLVHGAL
jgi:hypothetical protein